MEKKETVNIVVVDVTGKFELADDIIIKQKSSSYVGGIFNKEEIIVEKQPAYLADKDLMGIMNFFKYIATNAYLSENGLS